MKEKAIQILEMLKNNDLTSTQIVDVVNVLTHGMNDTNIPTWMEHPEATKIDNDFHRREERK